VNSWGNGVVDPSQLIEDTSGQRFARRFAAPCYVGPDLAGQDSTVRKSRLAAIPAPCTIRPRSVLGPRIYGAANPTREPLATGVGSARQ
jgi:hypothetical protein